MRITSAKAVLLVLVAAVAMAACRKSLPGSGGLAMTSRSVSSPAVVAGSAPAGKEATPGNSASAVLDAGRKLIRNGEISIEVRDFDASAGKAAEIARSFGGYVADSQASGDGGRRSGRLTIRVRATAFEDALKALRALGRVQAEHVGAQDITKAYTDLEARLRVKRDAAERIREILKAKTAKLGDVLEAEKQLSSLIEQIEVMEGERRYYDQQVALSTIAAELHEPEAVARPSAFAPLRQAFRDSLYNLSESLATFLTGMLYVLPWATLIVLLIGLARRLRRRRSLQSPMK